MLTPHPIRGRSTNEELFFDYYSRIVEWALQLTQMDRADAEDLIQDLYVQITNLSISLSDVDDIQPYLFKVLRNLHFSRLRQRSKIPISDLSPLDYDSLETGLGAVDWRGLFLIRADLKQICEFACERKESARAASIFLLRFFLGYYPSEVMIVAQITRVGVDKSLQFMRRETQLYLDKRDAMRPAAAKGLGNTPTAKPAESSHGLFRELQQTIFNSCKGPCFSPDGLDPYYRDESPVRLGVKELAHLVSCKSCLDRANVLLGLPLLDERSPDDTIGRDNSSGSGGSAEPKLSIRKTKKRPDARDRRLLKRSRNTWFEHRPACLEITVNGETRTSQRITAEMSEFHLKLNRAEFPEFIEIFSEQRLRLLYLHVLEPSLCPALEQHQTVELSGSRSLSLSLSFASDMPTVHVIYRDPVFAEVAIGSDDGGSTEADLQQQVQEHKESEQPSGSVVKFPARNQSLFVKTILSWLRIPRMHPVLATGLILAFSLILCFMFRLRLGPTVGTDAFLKRAQAQEMRAKRQAAAEVIYQKVRISSHGQVFDRAIYRDPERRRRPKQQHLDPQDQRIKQSLDLAGVDWDEPLSTANFRAWRDRQPIKLDVVTRSGRDLLTLTTSSDTTSKVIRESLTVRENDFHPVDRTIELRDEGTIEIAELNYDVMPWGVVNQDWFEPVLGKTTSDAPGILPALPVHTHHVLSNLEMNEAELEVRYALHKAGADLGEPVNVRVNGNDSKPVLVAGIVPSEAQKRELIASLSGIPHVGIHLQTEEEASATTLHNRSAIVQRTEPKLVSHRSAIEKELLDHLGDPVAVERFSARATRLADDLVTHAWALRRLSERYGAPGTTSETALTPSSRQLLQTMRHDHMKAMADATSELSTSLEPVLTSINGRGSIVVPKQTLFASAEEVQRLTMELLSGSGTTDSTDNNDPHKAAVSLLTALRSLETTLKEQP